MVVLFEFRADPDVGFDTSLHIDADGGARGGACGIAVVVVQVETGVIFQWGRPGPRRWLVVLAVGGRQIHVDRISVLDGMQIAGEKMMGIPCRRKGLGSEIRQDVLDQELIVVEGNAFFQLVAHLLIVLF